MQFITGSLGVQCDFCHMENAFEKDDKEPKQTARKMMQMVMALNKDDFGGQQKVTCYTCNQGALKPAITPVIADEPKSLAQDASRPQSTALTRLASVDQILEKYLQATGGAKALGKITTRTQYGLLALGTKSFPIEILSETPDSRRTTVHLADGANITSVTGQEGWSSSPGHPAHEMGPSELESAQMEAKLFFEVNLRTLFKELTVRGNDKIDGKDVLLVVGQGSNSPPVHLYFEVESGLLARAVYYTNTPLGLNPTEIDYTDYREQDSVKTPFQWTVSRPGRRFTIQIEKMEQGEPIDKTEFLKPATSGSH